MFSLFVLLLCPMTKSCLGFFRSENDSFGTILCSTWKSDCFINIGVLDIKQKGSSVVCPITNCDGYLHGQVTCNYYWNTSCIIITFSLWYYRKHSMVTTYFRFIWQVHWHGTCSHLIHLVPNVHIPLYCGSCTVVLHPCFTRKRNVFQQLSTYSSLDIGLHCAVDRMRKEWTLFLPI